MEKLSSISPCLKGDHLLRCVFATLSACWSHKAFLVSLLLEHVIPVAAGFALLASSCIAIRQVYRSFERKWSGERRRLLSRKGLVVSLASLLFAASCFYRALFVADEGAGLCRGAPSILNAPVTGRAIATVGEVSLVVQISFYILGAKERLGLRQTLWANFKRFTLAPVLLAECLSWCGVLSGITKFFCLEYVVWIFLATAWAWDSMILFKESHTLRDIAGHISLFSASVCLFVFNASVEIPHFFVADENDDGALESIFRCRQDAGSPLWTKRLPFFFAYFLMCSWCSVAISYRAFRTYGWGKNRYSKQKMM